MLVCLWVTGFMLVSVIVRYAPRLCCGCCDSVRRRWFWLHFGTQVFFSIRELLVLQFFEGWTTLLVACHVALGLVVIVTLVELWQLSHLRKYSPRAVDQIMDMVLLPANYGLLMAHTVRILSGQTAAESWMSDMFGFSGDDHTPGGADGAGKTHVGPEKWLLYQQHSYSSGAGMNPFAAAMTSSPPPYGYNGYHGFGAETATSGGAPGNVSSVPSYSYMDAAWDGYNLLDSAAASGLNADPGATPGDAARDAARLAVADTTIQTADIWESWALWSVLTMFTSIVDNMSKKSRGNNPSGPGGGAGASSSSRSRARNTSLDEPLLGPAAARRGGDGASSSREHSARGPRSGRRADGENSPYTVYNWGEDQDPSAKTEQDPLPASAGAKKGDAANGPVVEPTASLADRAVTSFQRFCFAILQLYVLSSMLSNIMQVTVKGLLGIHFPTLCPYLLQSCQYTCVSFWDTYVGPYQALIMSLLCWAAIYCVFVFEGAFHGELQLLDPYWKFFGVKGVVSVTWTQWLVIRYAICGYYHQWEAYYLYAFLTVMELPLLAIVHAFFAYPVHNVYLSISPEAATKFLKGEETAGAGGVSQAIAPVGGGPAAAGAATASGAATSRNNGGTAASSPADYQPDGGGANNPPLYPPLGLDDYVVGTTLNFEEARSAEEKLGGSTSMEPRLVPLRQYVYAAVMSRSPEDIRAAPNKRIVFATDTWIRYLIETSASELALSDRTARKIRRTQRAMSTMVASSRGNRGEAIVQSSREGGGIGAQPSSARDEYGNAVELSTSARGARNRISSAPDSLETILLAGGSEQVGGSSSSVSRAGLAAPQEEQVVRTVAVEQSTLQQLQQYNNSSSGTSSSASAQDADADLRTTKIVGVMLNLNDGGEDESSDDGDDEEEDGTKRKSSCFGRLRKRFPWSCSFLPTRGSCPCRCRHICACCFCSPCCIDSGATGEVEEDSAEGRGQLALPAASAADARDRSPRQSASCCPWVSGDASGGRATNAASGGIADPQTAGCYERCVTARRVRSCRKFLKRSIIFALTTLLCALFMLYSLKFENREDVGTTYWYRVQCTADFPAVPHTSLVTTLRTGICSDTQLACNIGYRGSPLVTCEPTLVYHVEGTCQVVGCGAPPRIPNANPIYKVDPHGDHDAGAGNRNHDGDHHGAGGSQNKMSIRNGYGSLDDKFVWNAGEVVHYVCAPGYTGGVQARCSVSGAFTVEGQCDLVGCGVHPPRLEHARAILRTTTTNAAPTRAVQPQRLAEIGAGPSSSQNSAGAASELRAVSDDKEGGEAGLYLQLPAVPHETEFDARSATYLGEKKFDNFNLSSDTKASSNSGTHSTVPTNTPLPSDVAGKARSSTEDRSPNGVDPSTEPSAASKSGAAPTGDSFNVDLDHETQAPAKATSNTTAASITEPAVVPVPTAASDSASPLLQPSDVSRIAESGPLVHDRTRKIDTNPPASHVTLKRSYAGERITFECELGYTGSPVAECRNDGQWDVQDTCRLFTSTLGCQCEPEWASCDDWLLGANCFLNYGCKHAGHSYQWCEVDPASCPGSAAMHLFGFQLYPKWDYCVDTDELADDADSHRKAVPSLGPDPARWLLTAFPFEGAKFFGPALFFVAIGFMLAGACGRGVCWLAGSSPGDNGTTVAGSDFDGSPSRLDSSTPLNGRAINSPLRLSSQRKSWWVWSPWRGTHEPVVSDEVAADRAGLPESSEEAEQGGAAAARSDSVPQSHSHHDFDLEENRGYSPPSAADIVQAPRHAETEAGANVDAPAPGARASPSTSFFKFSLFGGANPFSRTADAEDRAQVQVDDAVVDSEAMMMSMGSQELRVAVASEKDQERVDHADDVQESSSRIRSGEAEQEEKPDTTACPDVTVARAGRQEGQETAPDDIDRGLVASSEQVEVAAIDYFSRHVEIAVPEPELQDSTVPLGDPSSLPFPSAAQAADHLHASEKVAVPQVNRDIHPAAPSASAAVLTGNDEQHLSATTGVTTPTAGAGGLLTGGTEGATPEPAPSPAKYSLQHSLLELDISQPQAMMVAKRDRAKPRHDHVEQLVGSASDLKQSEAESSAGLAPPQSEDPPAASLLLLPAAPDTPSKAVLPFSPPAAAAGGESSSSASSPPVFVGEAAASATPSSQPRKAPLPSSSPRRGENGRLSGSSPTNGASVGSSGRTPGAAAGRTSATNTTTRNSTTPRPPAAGSGSASKATSSSSSGGAGARTSTGGGAAPRTTTTGPSRRAGEAPSPQQPRRSPPPSSRKK